MSALISLRPASERILTYVGKDARFENWDEAADAVAANYGASFDRYTRDDWVKMAMRNCREENGEIRFDYDMGIAEPFRTIGPAPKVDLWPLFAALGKSRCSSSAARKATF